MNLKKITQQSYKSPRQIWTYAICLTVLVSLFTFFALTLWASKPENWSNAFKSPISTKTIVISISDHESQWQDIDYDQGGSEYFDNIVKGSGGHWLGSNGFSIPEQKPGYLWYDGHLIAKGVITNQELSTSGEHYAYTSSDEAMTNADTKTVELIADGKSIVKGEEVTLHKIADNGDVYYSCQKCGNESAGFFRNNDQLFAYNDRVSEDILTDNKYLPCLFNKDSDIKHILETITQPEINDASCSLDGEYIATNKSRVPFSLIPMGGTESVVSVNGHEVINGNIIDYVVNNEGKLSYLHSDGSGQGTLTINGRTNYTFDGETAGSDGILYSPSLEHMAVILGDAWWIDGHPTGIDQSENVSLSDTAFYVYRF